MIGYRPIRGRLSLTLAQTVKIFKSSYSLGPTYNMKHFHPLLYVSGLGKIVITRRAFFDTPHLGKQMLSF